MQKSGYDAAQLPLGGGGACGRRRWRSRRPVARRPAEADDRMQLDAVRRDAGLAVDLVEEGDPRDRRRATQSLERARRRTARGDEGASRACRIFVLAFGVAPRRAGRGRKLGDHRLAAAPRIGDHEVDVAVVLELHLDELTPARDTSSARRRGSASGSDTPAPALRRSPRTVAAPRLKTQPAPRGIGERLHGPALDPATDLPRLRRRRFRRGEPGPGERDHCQAEDEGLRDSGAWGHVHLRHVCRQGTAQWPIRATAVQLRHGRLGSRNGFRRARPTR